MAQMYELLKGKFDVTKYEEEHKKKDQLTKLEKEFNELNNEIFSLKMGILAGLENPIKERTELPDLQKKKDNKRIEIENFKQRYNL